MRLLIIDKDAIEAIQKVVSYAEAHKSSIDQLKEAMAGERLPAGDDPGHVCFFNNGIRVVYSIEDQPMGMCRHLSVSVEASGTYKYPSEEAVTMIMTEFGFKYPLKDSKIWIEEDVLTPGGLNVTAINVLQLYE
jgi:hypothetical protein